MKRITLTIAIVLTYVATVIADIQIVCPDKAIVGSPVSISYQGVPENAAVKINKIGFTSNDTFLELFDANGKPVTIFWSMEPGPRTIQLIVCDHKNPIEVVTRTFEYGTPSPPPSPEPDAAIQTKIAPLVSYTVATTIDNNDLKQLSAFYADFASELSKSNVSDTGSFRQSYVEAGKQFFQDTNIKGKYGGLAGVIDRILSDSLSLNIGPLDKTETVKLLKGISWAFGKGVK